MGSLVGKATLPGEGSDLVAWCGTGMAAAIHGWRFMDGARAMTMDGMGFVDVNEFEIYTLW
jgi:hypothetical protein